MKRSKRSNQPNAAGKAGRSDAESKRSRPEDERPADLSPSPAVRQGWWAKYCALLAAPVSGASLGVFRIGLGLVMALEAWSLCQPNAAAISSGNSPLQTYYTGTDIRFHFPYSGFDWLPLLPAHWIYLIVALQGIAGLLMALGLFYRVAAPTVFLCWAYFFLVESTRTYWQSHYYLELLSSFLMIWMPATRRYSVAAWLGRGRQRLQTVPFWPVFLLRGQLVIAYFFAGVSKLTKDWLLDAVPVRWFLREEHVTARYAGLLSPAQFERFQSVVHSAWFAYLLSYTGVVFDLIVGFLFLFRRTRIFALLCMIIFHFLNHFLIFDDIGWFPLLGVATALIFLDPDWPERFWSWVRHPRVAKPDLGWLAAGGILAPGVGASLGWKLKASPPGAGANEVHRLAKWTVVLVSAWLAGQTFMPIRRFFMPGDSRFSYQGLSFSWRLKAEVRRAKAAQFFVKDAAVITTDKTGRAQIDWNQWRGDKVVYRRVTSGRIQWSQLPEIMVFLEPIVGERVIYNPYASNLRSEAGVRDRVSRIWNELYGREPAEIQPTMSVAQAFDGASVALRGAGHLGEASTLASLVPSASLLLQDKRDQREATDTCANARALLHQFGEQKEIWPVVLPFVEQIDPMSLATELHPPFPFFVIEDPQLLGASNKLVNPARWKTGAYTRDVRADTQVNVGGEPLVIHTADVDVAARDVMPLLCILDSEENRKLPPVIWWNSLKDLTSSKLMHISNQPFYLRRYARRVAGLWEKEYGRRPIVNASTRVSLNARPFQNLVDPEADLASVPVSWFGTNHWIKDLETPRIPRDAVEMNPYY